MLRSRNCRPRFKLAPNNASLHYNLGLAYKLKDQLDKAVPEFQNAIRLQPDLADAHYTLGVLFWQKGDFDKATEELQKAIQNQPNYAEAHYTLGTIYKQQGKLHGGRGVVARGDPVAAGFCRGAHYAGRGAAAVGRCAGRS